MIAMRQVYSPFELEIQQPAPLGLAEAPNISVVDWEALDESVWLTSKSLLLLQPDVIEASMSIPFMKDQHVKRGGYLFCGRHCEVKSLSEKERKNAGSDESQKIGSMSMNQNPASSFHSLPETGKACAELQKSANISQDSRQLPPCCMSIMDNPSGSTACSSEVVPPSAAAQITLNHEPTHAANES